MNLNMTSLELVILLLFLLLGLILILVAYLVWCFVKKKIKCNYCRAIRRIWSVGFPNDDDRPLVPKPQASISAPVLRHVAKSICQDWKELGREMGFTEDHLNLLQLNHKNDGHNEMAYQLLVKWKEKDGQKATDELLIQMLHNIDRTNLAEEIMIPNTQSTTESVEASHASYIQLQITESNTDEQALSQSLLPTTCEHEKTEELISVCVDGNGGQSPGPAPDCLRMIANGNRFNPAGMPQNLEIRGIRAEMDCATALGNVEMSRIITGSIEYRFNTLAKLSLQKPRSDTI